MPQRIAIVGAGMSGLTLGTLLSQQGKSVTVFEKARGPGGRMSTRRSEFGKLDHGAQYFTIRDDEFRHFLSLPIFEQTFSEWRGAFVHWKSGEFYQNDEEEPRYVGQPAMNATCKAMASNLDVRLGLRVDRLKKEELGAWLLFDDNDQELGGFDVVISSAPHQQTYDLFKGHSDIAEDIQAIDMLPCMTWMGILDGDLQLPYDGIRFYNHSVLGWAANNHSKVGRDKDSAIVIQTNFEWAKDKIDDDINILSMQVQEEAESLFSIDLSETRYKAFHRWLYSSPAKSLQQKCYWDTDKGLGACGDWCIGPRVECAFLSANELHKAMF